MSSDFIKRLTGRRQCEDVPVQAARPQEPKQRETEPQEQNRARRATTAALMGVRETQDDQIIPKDAVEVKSPDLPYGIQQQVADDADPAKNPPAAQQPNYAGNLPEPLLTPQVALVAPDVTPQALQPLDPSLVPHPQQQPPQATAVQPQPGSPQAGQGLEVLMNLMTGKSSAADKSTAPGAPAATYSESVSTSQFERSIGVQPASGLNPDLRQSMPEHVQGSAKKLVEVFSRYAPPPKLPAR